MTWPIASAWPFNPRQEWQDSENSDTAVLNLPFKSWFVFCESHLHSAIASF